MQAEGQPQASPPEVPPGGARLDVAMPQVMRFVFFALSVACVWPIFYVRYVPIQDLPQHLAAVRVLHDFDDPLLAFSRFFELDLWRTQYLAYYVVADLLCHVV